MKVFEAALMHQESMNSGFCVALSHAFHLEEIDLTGDVHVGDDGLSALSKGDIKLENNQSQVIGLLKLRIAKFSGLTKMADHSIMKLCSTSLALEHLELTKCEGLTEYSIDHIIRTSNSLKFIDLNSIPAITP